MEVYYGLRGICSCFHAKGRKDGVVLEASSLGDS